MLHAKDDDNLDFSSSKSQDVFLSSPLNYSLLTFSRLSNCYAFYSGDYEDKGNILTMRNRQLDNIPALKFVYGGQVFLDGLFYYYSTDKTVNKKVSLFSRNVTNATNIVEYRMRLDENGLP